MSQGVNINQEGLPFPLRHNELELESHEARDPIISLHNWALGLPKHHPGYVGAQGRAVTLRLASPLQEAADRRLGMACWNTLRVPPGSCVCSAFTDRSTQFLRRPPDGVLPKHLPQSQRRKQARWPVGVPPQQSCACTWLKGWGTAGWGP